MSSSLMGGSGQTEPALAMRESSVVEEWAEGEQVRLEDISVSKSLYNYHRAEEAPITVRMI